MEHTVRTLTPTKVSPVFQMGLQHPFKKERFFCSLSSVFSDQVNPASAGFSDSLGKKLPYMATKASGIVNAAE